MNAIDLLNAAAGHMEDRAITYDQPEGERSMRRAVAALNAVKGREVLVESDGWLLMQLLKLARDQARGVPHLDSLGDAVAYAALYGECRVAGARATEPAADAGGWIEWDGGKCPVPAGTVVDVRFRDLKRDRRAAESLRWSHKGVLLDIIAYRIYRAGVCRMSYLNHSQIVALVESGAIRNVDLDCINAASLDLRLGDEILIESECDRVIDYRARERLSMQTVKLDPERGFVLHPGEVMLAHTVEVCDFPDDLAALFRIKSSMGRVFLEHMDAGWVDPGFNGPLTLEFKNLSQHHAIRLRPGDRIGQLVFLRGDAVSEEQSYRKRGNYNGASGVKQIGWADADGWIEWNGGECPVPAGTLVNVRFRSRAESYRLRAGRWDWTHDGDSGDIIAYRIAGPAASGSAA